MRLFLFSIFILISGWANAYDPSDIKFSDVEYRRYIKPQFRNILYDYQTLLLTLNPHLQTLRPLNNDSRELLEKLEEIPTSCTKVNPECVALIKRLEKLLHSLLSDSSKAEITIHLEMVKVENVLRALELKNKLEDLIFKNIERAQNFLFFSKYSQLPMVEKMNVDLKSIFNLVHLINLELVDHRFRSEFSSFWVNFVKPGQIYIIMEDNQEYFKKQINQFNFHWHELHVGMTKRNKKVSGQVSTILATMESRWRSILKICLRP